MSQNVEFNLHPGQLEVFTDPHRFKVVAAGRRFGKSYLARVNLIVNALQETNAEGYDLSGTAVYYIAPTFQQAKDIMWNSLKDMARPWTKKIRENECVITLQNDRQIYLKGSDRPETLRGVGLSYVVMDEYAFMKPDVWTAIVRPVLLEVKGGAMFIGTPDGKNHFYDLFAQAADGGENGDWAAFTFPSIDNPLLSEEEIKAATKDMPAAYVKQEFEASFSSFGGTVFKQDMITKMSRPGFEGDVYMAVDPAGFGDVKNLTRGQINRLDETAIAIVKTGPEGWHVLDVVTGRWNVRETAVRILRTAQKYRPVTVGIEKGALQHALMPYLNDNMRRLNTFPPIVQVSHNNQKKQDRIVWALQGRMEQGRLTFEPGEYFEKVQNQLLDFPNPMSHDDTIDALAYIDQLSVIQYAGSYEDFGADYSGDYNHSLPYENYDNRHLYQRGNDNWHPIDSTTGF